MDDTALAGIHALVVDDVQDNRTILQVMLEYSGATVTVVENAADAIAAALKNPFDVILMDIQMAQMNGLEATQKLRSAGYNKPIVALTAYAYPEERRRCIDAGCDDHLAKPIKRNELLELISSLAKRT
jgi:two-component system, sensor histidine kinase